MCGTTKQDLENAILDKTNLITDFERDAANYRDQADRADRHVTRLRKDIELINVGLEQIRDAGVAAGREVPADEEVVLTPVGAILDPEPLAA